METALSRSRLAAASATGSAQAKDDTVANGPVTNQPCRSVAVSTGQAATSPRLRWSDWGGQSWLDSGLVL